jgi:hypothetical protein
MIYPLLSHLHILKNLDEHATTTISVGFIWIYHKILYTFLSFLGCCSNFQITICPHHEGEGWEVFGRFFSALEGGPNCWLMSRRRIYGRYI